MTGERFKALVTVTAPQFGAVTGKFGEPGVVRVALKAKGQASFGSKISTSGGLYTIPDDKKADLKTALQTSVTNEGFGELEVIYENVN